MSSTLKDVLPDLGENALNNEFLLNAQTGLDNVVDAVRGANVVRLALKTHKTSGRLYVQATAASTTVHENGFVSRGWFHKSLRQLAPALKFKDVPGYKLTAVAFLN